MLIGYMRVSTANDRQSTDLQRDALVAAGQSRSSAARQVARESGLPRRELFVAKRRRS